MSGCMLEFSLEFECPEASEHVMLSFPESYWLPSRWSAGVMVTLGLPGLLASGEENLPEVSRPRNAGLVAGAGAG